MMWLYCTATVNRGSDDVYVCKSPTVQVYHVLKPKGHRVLLHFLRVTTIFGDSTGIVRRKVTFWPLYCCGMRNRVP